MKVSLDKRRLRLGFRSTRLKAQTTITQMLSVFSVFLCVPNLELLKLRTRTFFRIIPPFPVAGALPLLMSFRTIALEVPL